MLGKGLLFGRSTSVLDAFGFAPEAPVPPTIEDVCYQGDAPTCVIAPTGSGKGRDFLIPNLLTYPGPVIVLDTKGELSAVCGRARRALGQKVHILDPFGVTGCETDRLNPFDQFSLPKTMLEPDSEMLASLLGDGHGSTKEPFWPDTATSLISGLVAYIAACKKPEDRNIKTLRDLLCGDDTDYALAVILDTQKAAMPPFAYKAISGYLSHADSQTRPSVLSTARTFLTAINSDQVAGCMANSTISLADVMKGTPQSIFITVPPEKLVSHRCMLRLWVGVLLTTVMRRKRIPKQRTLFVLDEAAQLGTFDPLLAASTLLRGFGLQLIMVWQDMAQIKSRYPADWSTIVNNSATLLAFGFGHYNAAKEYGDVLGFDPAQLASMKPDEAILAMRGEGTRKISRINYLTEPTFAGMFDENPYFIQEPEVEPVTSKSRARKTTWQQKIAHTRDVFRAMIADAQKEGLDEDDERVLGALMQMADAIEEIGKKIPAVKKRQSRPKKAGRGV
jgi:type IV secretion system protein VirD4